MLPTRPPVLLTEATAYGTLAAVRCLGRAGVPVSVAGPEVLAPSHWSRHATRRLRAPGTGEPERHLEWLLEFGAREPGHVLYPTNDDSAWLIAFHADELARSYRLRQPAFATVRRLLDKRLLAEACETVGIRTPPAAFAEVGESLEDVAARAAFPVLLKPRIQVLHRSHSKGRLVLSADELPAALDAYVRENRYHPWIEQRFPEVVQPMVQAYLPEALQRIYSVAGFADEHGEIVALAAQKVLQRPRRLGIGVCFEAAPLAPELLARLRALCRAVGYHGVFEVEFIEANGESYLIDFNPRFYSQMALDVERGLPLPLLAYEHALGESTAFRRAADRLRGAAPDDGAAYMHRLRFEALMHGQRLSRLMSAAEVRQWRTWQSERRTRTVDAVLDRRDPLPAVLDYLAFCRDTIRHPRASVRTNLLGM